jgi:hypothetical protein
VLPNGEADDNPPDPNGALDVLGIPKGEAEPEAFGTDGFPNGEAGGFMVPNDEDVFIVLLLVEKGDAAAAGVELKVDDAAAGVELKVDAAAAGVELKVDAGAGGVLNPELGFGCAPSNGLGTLYLAANFLNISGSRPWKT